MKCPKCGCEWVVEFNTSGRGSRQCADCKITYWVKEKK